MIVHASSAIQTMRKECDFSASRKNPYAAQLKKSVTIRLDQGSIAYFKALAEETGIPYQSLINLYLKGVRSVQEEAQLGLEVSRQGSEH